MYSAESELPDIPYGLLDVLPIPYYSVGLYKKNRCYFVCHHRHSQPLSDG
mgnify:FL=1